MKTAKPPAVEPPSHRRSQPVRQTRTNPPRTTNIPGRSLAARDSLDGGHAPDQPIDIFPATTHFADAITALPRELVRHITLLKEVEAKTFAPEDALFKLVEAALKAPLPEPQSANGSSSSVAPGSAAMSSQNSSSGIVLANSLQSVPSTYEPLPKADVFDPSNLPRRQLYRQTAFKINELIGSLEEKNHVISVANEALQKQMARIEDVWPHLEKEYSDEAKWGSTTHWAYPENRAGRASHAERSRREAASVISAAAQAIADEAAARSDARKQAVMAKKNLKTQQHQESDFDEAESRTKAETTKKPQASSKVRKAAETAASVGLGISTSGAAANGANPPAPKRRKVEKEKPAASAAPPNGAPAPTEKAMSTVFGANAPKPKTTSPRETPAPEPKKRKALPTNGQASKKSRNGVSAMSPSVTSSPVLGTFPDPKSIPRSSPAPTKEARPSSSRARQNSTSQPNADAAKTAASVAAISKKPNGSVPGTPDISTQGNWPKPVPEPAKPAKEPSATTKTDAQKKEPEPIEPISIAAPTGNGKKDVIKSEEGERKVTEPIATQLTTVLTVTKSGRASKPSTPALATFQEAAARSRTARTSEPAATAPPKRAKKSTAAAQAMAAQLADEDGTSSVPGDDDGDDAPDPDEQTFCYCNGVSYGEMIACDADGCEREWFHLGCVGLKVAPKGNAKWYCEDCKERMKGGKKSNGR